jgi:hypothetical protein
VSLPPRQHQLYRALRDYLGWSRPRLAQAVAEVTKRDAPGDDSIRQYELALPMRGKDVKSGAVHQVPDDPPLRPKRQDPTRNIPAPWEGATEGTYAAVLRHVRDAGIPFADGVQVPSGREWQELHGLVLPADDFAWEDPREQDEHGRHKRPRKPGEQPRPRLLSRVAIDYALGLGLFGPRVWLAAYEVVRLLPGEGTKKRPKSEPCPFEPYEPAVVFGGSLQDRDRADDHAATLGPDAVVLLRPRGDS